MKMLSDGTSAISFEPIGGIVRLLFEPLHGDHPPIHGVGFVRPLWGGVVMLSAFDAQKLTRGHMRLIVRLLLEQGYRVLYADRIDGHVLPLAEKIQEGDFAGLWRLDLTTVPFRRRNDQQNGDRN